MDVGGAAGEGRGDCGERQIVGGDETDGVALDEAADQGFASLKARLEAEEAAGGA